VGRDRAGSGRERRFWGLMEGVFGKLGGGKARARMGQVMVERAELIGVDNE
jgi:hypothetical protein